MSADPHRTTPVTMLYCKKLKSESLMYVMYFKIIAQAYGNVHMHITQTIPLL